MQPADPSNLMRSEAELVLEQTRRQKADKTKSLGDPIEIPGKALDIHVKGNIAWIAENTSVIRKLNLETGKTLQLFRGHSAPVTSLAFFNEDETKGSAEGQILVTGSWDKTIKLWRVKTKELISSTSAHSDFVKALLVVPSLRLLISAGSDKIVRLWDLSTFADGQSLRAVGNISAHTRPVESLAAFAVSDTAAILYTADTMGLIMIWDLSKESGDSPRWACTLREELSYHRTKINEIIQGNGQLWTASSDDTLQLHNHSPSSGPISISKPVLSITHPTAVRAVLPLNISPIAESYVLTGAGDIIRVYDIGSLDEPELVAEVDAHWHNVIALRLWLRRTESEGQARYETWIISNSLDGTIRKWKLAELLTSPQFKPGAPKFVIEAAPDNDAFKMSEEEERELAELMSSD